MNKKKKRKRKSNWTPPRNYTNFFSPEADQEFKRKHPIGYPALVMLGMVVLLLPACLFPCRRRNDVDKLALVPITPRTEHGVSLPPAGRLNKAENGI